MLSQSHCKLQSVTHQVLIKSVEFFISKPSGNVKVLPELDFYLESFVKSACPAWVLLHVCTRMNVHVFS